MLSFRYPGDRIPYYNTGSAITSNSVVVVKAGVSGKIGVAVDDIAATTGFGTLAVRGVFELAFKSDDVAAAGDLVYWDASNSRLTTTKTANTRAGWLVRAKADAETTGEVMLAETMETPGLLYTQVAAGTAHSDSTTETAIGSFSIPANTLKVGDVIRVKFQGIATATNSTDTLLVKLYIGGITGTALLTGTATDVANNNIFCGECDITIRTTGATGTLVAFGSHSDVPAASGTAVPVYEITPSTTVDTTAAQVIAVGADWSVASASNSCRLDILTVEKLR